jgi:phosphopantothenoylcysteine decarboxylase
MEEASHLPPSYESLTSPFDSTHHLKDNKIHILLAASGSVATIKIPNIIRALLKKDPSNSTPPISIRLILTNPSAQFLAGQAPEQPDIEELSDIPGVDGVYTDDDEWSVPWSRGKKILHIELRRWADIMIVAPLSANTLAKMVGGLCDNLLLSTMRAWDVSGLLDPPHEITFGEKTVSFPDSREGTKRGKVIVVAPAMNTAMWVHPVTKKQVKVLEEEWGVGVEGGWIEVLRPVEKELACGDTGSGAMCPWEKIVERIKEIVVEPLVSPKVVEL